jgi:predicted enzyme related to lactoylglutathione lyase
MTIKTNAVNWFEIYVTDFSRAKRFYESILKSTLQDTPSENCENSPKENFKMAMFPFDMANGIGGAIVLMTGYSPGQGGTIIYLNVEGDLDGVIERIPAAGGSIVKPRMAIGEHGFIAIFKDSEGNIVGLHSMK